MSQVFPDDGRIRRRRSTLFFESQVVEARLLLSASVWTQQQADSGHSGYVDATVAPAAIVKISTITTTNSNSDVAIDQDFVFRTAYVSGSGITLTYEVQAYRLSTGALAWRTPFQTTSMPSAPSLFNAKVYVNAPGHSATATIPTIYAFDAVDGHLVASRSYGAQWGSPDRPVVKNNLLLAEAGYYGGMSGYQASTLVELWHTGGNQIQMPAATIASNVAIAWDNSVYNLATGQRTGAITVPQTSNLNGAMYSSSGRLFLQGVSAQPSTTRISVTAFDGTTRQAIWTRNFDAVRAKAVANGIVAVVSDKKVWLLSEVDGTVIRSWDSTYPMVGSIAMTKSHVFVQSFNGIYSGTATVHAINLATGLSDWKFSNTDNKNHPGMSIAVGGGNLVLSTWNKVNIFRIGDLTPVVVDDYVEALEDTPISIAVLRNDRAVQGARIQSITSASAEKGKVTIFSNSLRYVPAKDFSGRDVITYTVVDSAGRTASGMVTVDVTSQIDPPVPRIQATLNAVEGANVTFDGSTSTNPESGTMSYTWAFSDGVVLTGAIVTRSFPDNGTYTATLTVDNGMKRSASRSILVTNVAPKLQANLPGTVLLNNLANLQLTTSDVATDLKNDFQYSVNWNDGTAVETVTGASSLTVSHAFVTTGTFVVTVSVIDKDGGKSNVVSMTITATATSLINQTLIVEGTGLADTIVLQPGTAADSVDVIINGAAAPTFLDVKFIVVSTRDGSDNVTVKKTGTTKLAIPLLVSGGAGGDIIDLTLSESDNVLFGDDGDDTLKAGAGRDLLVGGKGTDALSSGAGEDILIGGVMQLDFRLDVLGPIMAEWTRTDAAYSDRIGHLIGALPGGNNGSVILTPVNMLDDRTVDSLFGEDGLDLYFGNSTGIGADRFVRKTAREVLLSLPNPA